MRMVLHCSRFSAASLLGAATLLALPLGAGALGCAEVVIEEPPSQLGSEASEPPARQPTNAPPPSATQPDPGPTLADDPIPPSTVVVTVPPPGSEPEDPGQPELQDPGDEEPNPVGGTLLLLDDFEDGDDAGWIADVADGDDLVGSWSPIETADGWVYAQVDDSFDDKSWTVGGDVSWTDVTVETRFRFTSVNDMEDAIVMLAARFQTKDHYYYLQYRGDGSVKIRKRVDGSEPEMSSDDLDRLAVIGEWITLAFTVQGNTLSASVDGVVVTQGIVDNDLASGGIALGVRENAAVEFDDVRVTTP